MIEYVVEYFHPWFPATQRAAEWSVVVSASPSAYAEMQASFPSEAPPQPCFAHDQQVLAMPASQSAEEVTISDAERSCFLRLRRGQVELVADPETRRWRFTLLWIIQEIAATRLRQTHVDLHAASVEYQGRALVIAGPKNAGKTTLSFYLMESRGWGSIANDRSFIGGEAPPFVAAGMPTAVKIRPPTLTQFPQLCSGLPPVARPYLYSRAELATAVPSEELVGSADFALTPNQIASRLGAEMLAEAPCGAIVFPEICAEEAAWGIEPLAPDEVATRMRANLYGAATGERPSTFFEELGGGRRDAPQALIDAIAGGVAGYRVRLGRNAYADSALSQRLAQLLPTR